jgi:hypothetical protein
MKRLTLAMSLGQIEKEDYLIWEVAISGRLMIFQPMILALSGNV